MSTPDTQTETQVQQRPAIRWWPVVVIVSLASGFWVYIWRFQDVHRQTQNLQTTILILATLILLVLWVLLLSRMPWKRRLLFCGGVVGLVGTLAATLEIRGVTGDMLPVIEWRWTKTTSQLLALEQPTIEPQGLPMPVESSNDYPQISGPNRTSKLSGPQLARDWEAQPPELLWRQPIGAAWSGFSVVGQYAITMEQRGESELVACYHLLTGDLIWTHADESHYASVIAGEGPRTVPTIVDGRVFTLGPSGILNCLDLADGSTIWSKNIIIENETSAPGWGVSCSPLVTEGKVIVSAGGDSGRSLLAYDVETGSLVWSAGDDSASHSSPVLATLDGVSQTLIFNGPGVKSHDVNTGEVLWGYDWRGGHPHIVMPVVLSDDRVLISSGYGTGSQLVQVSQDPQGSWSASQVWDSKRLKSKFANIIVHDGYIYGLDDGIFVCLDLASGKRQWKRGRYGHGQIIQAGDLLLVMAESGDLVLLEPTPEEHRELSRFSVLNGKTWNPPALAGQYLLVRNDKEAACYRLSIEQP
ncbi:MAG: PQQ-binding-like beta-propeller repeat protein [Planctomycetes bacterium]|nr:PQQ-binding-like beta-propeller repeat protein [Planctomycetota bacterium]